MPALKKRHASKRGFIRGYDGRARGLMKKPPLAERIRALEEYYMRNGLDKGPLMKTMGYRKLNEKAKNAGLGDVRLNYEIVSPFPYSPVRIIPVEQRAVIRTTPETVLTVDSLLKVFPELVERAWAYEMKHEVEHARGSALMITTRMNELWREGMPALREFKRLIAGFEIAADIQCFMSNGRDVSMFVENVPMFAVLFNSIHHSIWWVVDEPRFSEEQRNADMLMLNIRYPFLKKGIVERMLDNISKARAELKRHVGNRDLGSFSIVAEARRRAKALQEFAVKVVYGSS